MFELYGVKIIIMLNVKMVFELLISHSRSWHASVNQLPCLLLRHHPCLGAVDAVTAD